MDESRKDLQCKVMKGSSLVMSPLGVRDREVVGVASTWDEDNDGERCVRGCYSKSLAERPTVPLRFQHLGPIGMVTQMLETPDGLIFRAKVSRTRYGDDALTLIGDNVVSQVSIGYRTKASRTVFDLIKGGGSKAVRELTELQLFELSLCDAGVNSATYIARGTATQHLVDQLELARLEGKVMNKRATVAELKEYVSAAIRSVNAETMGLVATHERKLAHLIDLFGEEGGPRIARLGLPDSAIRAQEILRIQWQIETLDNLVGED